MHHHMDRQAYVARPSQVEEKGHAWPTHVDVLTEADFPPLSQQDGCGLDELEYARYKKHYIGRTVPVPTPLDPAEIEAQGWDGGWREFQALQRLMNWA